MQTQEVQEVNTQQNTKTLSAVPVGDAYRLLDGSGNPTGHLKLKTNEVSSGVRTIVDLVDGTKGTESDAQNVYHDNGAVITY